MTFPDSVDSALQTTIKDWFQYRPVCDNDRFNVFFNRVLNRDMARYNELLRVEPGISRYDWLVQRYHEMELKRAGSGSLTKTGSENVQNGGTQNTEYNKDFQKSGTGTFSGSTSGTGSRDLTGTDDMTRTLDRSNAEAGSDNKTYSETNSLDKQTKGSKGGSLSETNDLTKTGTENEHTYSGTGDGETISRSVSGGETGSSYTGKRTDTVSPHVSKVESHGGHVSAWSGNQQIQKTLPMSESYSTMIEPGDDDTNIEDAGVAYKHAYQHMPALDWSSASAQAQDGHREYTKDKTTVTTSYEYGEGVDGDITTHNMDKDDLDATVKFDSQSETQSKTYSKDVTTEKTFNDRVDNGSKLQSTSESTTGTDAEAGKKEYTDGTVTAKSVTGTESEDTGKSNTEKELTSDTGSENHSTTDSVSDTGKSITTFHNDLTKDTTTQGSQTSTNDQTDHEIYTGRYDSPARILQEAVNFIKITNAWSWLEQQLEPCFLGIYEV